MNEKAVKFKNSRGRDLFGVVHVPENQDPATPRIGVNILNPGIKYRVAPNRLNVKMARSLCSAGYHVLRFDPEGVGDSEGELDEGALVVDIWEKIQKGLFVQDTLDANGFFMDTFTLDRLALAGNCGGAITALIASALDRRVGAACLVDVPVNLRDAKSTFADKAVSNGQKADFYYREYLKRAFQLSSWVRFISLKTNFRALIKTLGNRAVSILTRRGYSDGSQEDVEPLIRSGRLNAKFFDSLENNITRGLPLLFVLAGGDPGTEIFDRYVTNGYLKRRRAGRRGQDMVEIAVIPGANHVYTTLESQDNLIEEVVKWLPMKLLASTGEVRRA